MKFEIYLLLSIVIVVFVVPVVIGWSMGQHYNRDQLYFVKTNHSEWTEAPTKVNFTINFTTTINDSVQFHKNGTERCVLHYQFDDVEDNKNGINCTLSDWRELNTGKRVCFVKEVEKECWMAYPSWVEKKLRINPINIRKW